MGRYLSYDGRKILSVSDSPHVGCLEISDEISDEKLINDYEIWRGKIILKDSKRDETQLRVALVGVYKIVCGISTYAEMLFPEIAELVGEYKIFAEEAEVSEQPDVVRCWKRGTSLQTLCESIRAYDPDIVLIEHEFGIFPDARHWLSFMTQMQQYYKTFVMFHSIFRDHHDKTVCENAAPNILAHTELGANLIKSRTSRPVHVIPHGCKTCVDVNQHWNIYRSKHTFMQFGFGFEYKGWENSLKTVSVLKKIYVDVFFTGLFSESPFNLPLHERYYKKLMVLVKDLDIENNVAFSRGFVSDYILDCHFRTNQVAIFPYIENGVHTVFGVTGAARIAMSAGIPTVVSRAPMFYDLEGVCPRGSTPEEFAEIIEKLWGDRKNQIAIQNKFLEQNSWKVVARMHVDLFK